FISRFSCESVTMPSPTCAITSSTMTGSPSWARVAEGKRTLAVATTSAATINLNFTKILTPLKNAGDEPSSKNLTESDCGPEHVSDRIGSHSVSYGRGLSKGLILTVSPDL